MHNIGLWRIAITDMGHVVNVDHRAVDGLDRQIAQLRDDRRRIVELNAVFKRPDLLGADGRDQILRGQCIGDVLSGQAARL